MSPRDLQEIGVEQVATGEALPRLSLFVACVLHALPLGWAALVLPSQSPSWFTVTVGLLAALHAAVAALALTGRARALKLAWRILAIYSLLLLVAITWIIGSSALYLSELYRGVGRAVSAALFGIWGLFVLLTVPVSAWGLAYTLPRSHRGRARLVRGAGVGLLLLTLSSLWLGRRARAEAVVAAASAGTGAMLERIAKSHAWASGAPRSAASSLLHATPALCREPVDAARLTLLVSALDGERRPFASCIQAAQLAELEPRLMQLLEDRALPGGALAVELVRAVQHVPRVHPLLDALSVRPARDGLCARAACLAPWQLVTLDAFTRYRPLEAVRDASFGVSLDELSQALGSAHPAAERLIRIETDSYLLHDARVVPYVRLRPVESALDPQAIERAVAAAARHILAAQRDDGAFRYLLWPFSGRTESSELSLPRQAGTTLALCELVPKAQSEAVVARALLQLKGYEQQRGELSAISDSLESASLGQSALPLIAFASCRGVVGELHDALIGRLARLLMAMQRDDGSFYPELDLAAVQPNGRHTTLYAAGQAVLALVLVEQLAAALKSPALPAQAQLHAAVERAMQHYGRAHWPKALRSLFYLEENWHCLAARAALRSHRNDAYEQLCLDYVDFKARLVLSADEIADPEHVGGYGLSSMFPPHSTASAGFAEALAAAMQLKHARGLALTRDRALMKGVLGFVLRQQWSAESCFACAPGAEAVGGFSETSASSVIRIDYVQHAMAALGHGAASLALGEGAR